MLKQVLAILGTGMALVASPCVAQDPPQLIVSRGTALAVTTTQPLSSATARPGDDVPLRLFRPLVVNGVTLLREGEVLHGKVTRVQRAGPKCHYGQVRWNLDHLDFADKSRARSRVYTDMPWVRPMPDRLPLGPEQNVGQRIVVPVLAAPLIGLALLVESPRFFMHDSRNDGCGDGKEYFLPAKSILAVVITRDHHVRF